MGDSLVKNWIDEFSYDFGHHFIDVIEERDRPQVVKRSEDVYFWN